MDFTELYAQKKMTAAQAAALVKSGDWVDYGWAVNTPVAVDAEIQRFLAGDDVLLDREFFLHDIQASTAHAEGLQRTGILSGDELAGLKRELAILGEDFRHGRTSPPPPAWCAPPHARPT